MAFKTNQGLYVNVHLSWKPNGEDGISIEKDHTIPDSMTHTIGIHEFAKMLCEGYSYNLHTTNQNTNFTLQDGVLVFTTSDYYLELQNTATSM